MTTPSREPPEKWELRLYTAGQSPKSIAAYTNLNCSARPICQTSIISK